MNMHNVNIDFMFIFVAQVNREEGDIYICFPLPEQNAALIVIIVEFENVLKTFSGQQT